MKTATIDRYPGYVFCENGDVIGPRGFLIRGAVNASRKSGYRYLRIRVSHKHGKTIKASRLICEAFHGPPPSPKHQAAHGNGNRTDDRAENLRWATPSENQMDRVLHGTSNRGARHRSVKLTEADVKSIRMERAHGIGWRMLGKKYGVHETTIIAACSGKSWRHL